VFVRERWETANFAGPWKLLLLRSDVVSTVSIPTGRRHWPTTVHSNT
jgi:hypothetical protein